MMSWGTTDPAMNSPVLRSIGFQPCKYGSVRKFWNPAHFQPPVVKLVPFTYEKAMRTVS